MKSLLLVITTGFVLALGTAAPAGAAAPCWKALINDWYDGSIDRTYPPACYTAAIHHLPQDVSTYSSAKDDIERALLASVRQDRGGDPPSYNPSDPSSGGGDGSSGSSSGGGDTGSSEESSKGIITRAIEWLGPSNAASVPLPLLILAGVAFLLLAAAGGSFVNRRIQERRTPPPPP